jgi:hypothetical protein
MIRPLTAKREKFCQLVAAGATYTNAYLEAHQKPAGYDRKGAAEEGSRLDEMSMGSSDGCRCGSGQTPRA